MTCKHCGDELTPMEIEHAEDLCMHEGLCCDCLDLSVGMPLKQLNEERRVAGKNPITRPWPGLDERGNKIGT